MATSDTGRGDRPQLRRRLKSWTATLSGPGFMEANCFLQDGFELHLGKTWNYSRPSLQT